MKVLYYGGTFCTDATLKRLPVVAQEITFVDRPSVKLSETSGTVGIPTEARRIEPLDPKCGVVISAHAPYANAVPMYQQYLKRDWQNAAFRHAVLDGLNDSAFAGRVLALDGNYGDATGQQIRDALLADSALRAPDLPALRRDHDAPHNGWMLLVQQLLDPAKHAPQHLGIGARQPHRQCGLQLGDHWVRSSCSALATIRWRSMTLGDTRCAWHRRNLASFLA